MTGPAGKERRKSDQSAIQEINDKLEEGSLRMDGIELQLGSMAEATATTNDGVQELLDIWRAFKGFARVWGWGMRGLRLLAIIGLFAAAVVTLIKTGQWHWPAN